MHRDEAETEQHYIKLMGPDLGALFFRCWKECTLLHLKWREFLILYGTSQERVDLLNKSGSAFFAWLHSWLWESLVLQLCRITDPPQSAGKPNMTVQRLPDLVAAALKPDVETAVAQLKDASEFARQIRNLQIGHNDLALMMGHENARSLPKPTKEDFQRALVLLAALLNRVESHYSRSSSSTSFDNAVPLLGNADKLLDVLGDGVAVEDERRRRMLLGEPMPEYLKERKKRPV